MKNLKKVLALVLAMVLVIGTVASAKSYPDVKPGNNDAAYEAIDALSTLGLIDGYKDGTFKPEKILNRAEGAKLIAAALSKKDLINERPETGFVDVDGVKGFSWAMGYIDYLEGKNVNGTSIVIGIGDNKFAPERELSYKEFVKMLVVALGYAPLTDNDYDKYLGVAESIGLLENVPVNNINEDDKVSRADAAILLYNAVRINTMVPSKVTALGYVVSDKYLLEDSKNIAYVGLAPDEDFNSASDDVLDPTFDAKTGKLNGIEYYYDKKTTGFALNDYLTTSLIRANVGRNVEGIFYDATSLDQSKNYDEMLYIDFGADKTTKTTYDIKANDLTLKDDKYIVTSNGEPVKYTYKKDVTDEIDNWFDVKFTAGHRSTENGFSVNHKGTVTFVESYYGDLLAVIADTYTDGIVTKVDATRKEIHINEFEDTNSNICVYNNSTRDIVIKVDSVANVKKGDYVAATVGSDYANVEVIATAVTGKVEKVNTYKDNTEKYVINGTEYALTKGGLVSKLEKDNEGTFYIAKDGTIYKYEAKAVPSNKDWVVVIGNKVEETVKVMSLTTGATTTYHVGNGVNFTNNGVHEITITQTVSGPFITKADVVNWDLAKLSDSYEYTYVKAANVLAKVDATVGAGFALEADAKVITGKGDTTAVKDITALNDGYTYNDVRAEDIDGNGLADIIRIENAPSKDADAANITKANGTYAVVKADYATDGGLKDTLVVYIGGQEKTIKADTPNMFKDAKAGQVYKVEFSPVLGKEDVAINFTIESVDGMVGKSAASNGLVTKIEVNNKTYYLTSNTQYYTRVQDTDGTLPDNDFIKPTNETTIKENSNVTINANDFGFVTDIVITEYEK